MSMPKRALCQSRVARRSLAIVRTRARLAADPSFVAPQTARVYDVAAGTLQGTFAHGAPVLDAAFENEGLIYTGGLGGAVKRCGIPRHVSQEAPKAYAAYGTQCGARFHATAPACCRFSSLRWLHPAAEPAMAPSLTCPALPCLLCRYDFFAGQEASLGTHDAPVKCVEWLPSRGLLVTGSWDRWAMLGRRLL